MKAAIFSTFILLTLAGIAAAQKADDVLVTATGLTFTPASLSENIRKAYLEQNELVAAERRQLFAEFVRDALIAAEAKAANSTPESIVSAEMKKLAEPTAVQIQAVYDANRSSLGGRTLDEVRPQIAAFLRNGAEQKAVSDMMDRLKGKHKFVAGKDPASAGLQPTDVLFTLAGRSFTAAEFDSQTKALIGDIKAEVMEEVVDELENAVFSALVAQEARSQNKEASDVIAAEVTSKLKEFSDEERLAVETAFKKKLFTKYAVKMLVRQPAPIAHAVTADDDPVFGSPNAPVTVIMFSDFQCSACSATHPVLKRALTAYGNKVRLVVRDFPLESIHANAFRAALAANAARLQGKFFEYIELLYSNQDRLDDASLKRYASELGLNVSKFELDLASEKTAEEVRKDQADGLRFGARGTPTIFVNGVRVFHLSADHFRRAIDRALAPAAAK